MKVSIAEKIYRKEEELKREYKKFCLMSQRVTGCQLAGEHCPEYVLMDWQCEVIDVELRMEKVESRLKRLRNALKKVEEVASG